MGPDSCVYVYMWPAPNMVVSYKECTMMMCGGRYMGVYGRQDMMVWVGCTQPTHWLHRTALLAAGAAQMGTGLGSSEGHPRTGSFPSQKRGELEYC